MSGLRNAEIIPPVEQDRSVIIIIFEELLIEGWNMLIVEPALKKSQPTASINVPNTTNGNELIWKSVSYCS